MNYETASEIEIAIANWFGWRAHVMVPNISWGLFIYELDMVVLSASGYAYEIEIKVSKSDLIRDKEKWHRHRNIRIKRLWFAVPKKLEDHIEHIPKHAGIIVVSKAGIVNIVRSPIDNKLAKKLTIDEQFQLARLGALRIWALKTRIKELEKSRKDNSNEKNI